MKKQTYIICEKLTSLRKDGEEYVVSATEGTIKQLMWHFKNKKADIEARKYPSVKSLIRALNASTKYFEYFEFSGDVRRLREDKLIDYLYTDLNRTLWQWIKWLFS